MTSARPRSGRWPLVAAWGLWAFTLLGLPAIAWLDHLSRGAARPELVQLTGGGAVVPPVLGLVSAATVGAVLACRRPRHPVGWLLLALGLSLAAGGVVASYSAYGLVARPGALPAANAVARYSVVLTVVALPVLSFVLLLTPTGSLPSPRWRWWAYSTVAAAAASMVAITVAGGELDPRYQAANTPFDFRGLSGALLVINQLGLAASMLAVGVAAASLVVRFRRARGVERLQLRWVALAAGAAGIGAVVALVAQPVGASTVVSWAVGTCVAVLPVAIGAAILRYRLYDLDRIISRTLTYALITAVLVGVYVLVAVVPATLFDLESDLLVAGATLAAAAAFGPVRRRVQVGVDRRFDRSHYNALQTADAFRDRLRHTVDLEDLSADLLITVRTTVQPAHAAVWLRGTAATR